jgi:hypothetical protein
VTVEDASAAMWAALLAIQAHNQSTSVKIAIAAFPATGTGFGGVPELAGLRRSVQRGQPYGEVGWAQRLASRLGLESTLRPCCNRCDRPAMMPLKSNSTKPFSIGVSHSSRFGGCALIINAAAR